MTTTVIFTYGEPKEIVLEAGESCVDERATTSDGMQIEIEDWGNSCLFGVVDVFEAHSVIQNNVLTHEELEHQFDISGIASLTHKPSKPLSGEMRMQRMLEL